MPLPKGTRLLRVHIKARGISLREAARQLQEAPSRVHDWLNGTYPRDAARAAIELWSGGDVPASVWER